MKKKKPRVVWITGASSGIGKALAEVFALHGDTVIASARTQSGLNALSSKISATGGVCTVVTCDVQSEASVSKAAKKIFSSQRHIDILINNAGITYFKNFLDTSAEEFDQIIHTNLRGIFLMTQAVLPSMLQKRNGLVLNILSYAAKKVYTKSSVYSASKAGAAAMMNGLRAEVLGQGVHIVNVYPGAVATPIWHQSHLEKFGDQMMAPEQVAELLYQISIQPSSLTVEEIVLRPQIGDL